MDDKLLFTIIGVVFLILQFIFQMVTKRSNTEILGKLDNVMLQYGEITKGLVKDVITEIKENKEECKEPMNQLLHNTRKTRIKVDQQDIHQKDIVSALLDNTLAHHSNIETLKRLNDRIEQHEIICKERSDRLEQTISAHAIECRENHQRAVNA